MGRMAVHSPGASQGSWGSESKRHPMPPVLGFVLEVEVGDLGKGPCEL